MQELQEKDLELFDNTVEGRRRKVGLNLRRARQLRKMTQLELAKKVHKSTVFICYLELGMREAKVEDLYKICKALKVDLFYILKLYA